MATTILPPEIVIALIAMLPVAELRVAIPIGLTVYNLPILTTLFWTITGNMIVICILLISFEHIFHWLQRRSASTHTWLNRILKKAHRKLDKDIKKYGWLALALFVAIPLPGKGSWAAALVASLLGLSKTKAFIGIFIGTMISAFIMTLVTLGVATTLQTIFS